MIVPEGQILVAQKLEITLRYYSVWRYSVNDGLYSRNIEQMTREPDINGIKKGSFVTHGFIARIDYNINEHFNFSFMSGGFFAGEYIVNTGNGKSSFGNFLTAIYKF